jgi:hypothetical protein
LMRRFVVAHVDGLIGPFSLFVGVTWPISHFVSAVDCAFSIRSSTHLLINSSENSKETRRGHGIGTGHWPNSSNDVC